MRRLLATGVLVFSIILVSSPALSQENPWKQKEPPQPVRVRDGLMLRLTAGAGWSRFLLDGLLEEETDVTGPTQAAEVSLGGMLFGGLAFHGSVWGWDVVSPTMYRSWGGADDEYTTGDASARAAAFGAGFTYFFPPGEAYVSLMGGTGFFQVQGPEAATDPEPSVGVVARALLGWEWMHRGSWDFGAAAALDLWRSHVEDEESYEHPDDPCWVGLAVTACLTATYN